MICRTPGCGMPVPERDYERVFCERCGWPLAQAEVSHAPERTCLRGSQVAELTLRVANAGAGRLLWKVAGLPAGVTGPTDPVEVAPFGSCEETLLLDPSAMPEGEAFDIRLLLRDQTGSGPSDLRRGGADQCWREHTERFDVKWQRYGPLIVRARTLLFGGGVEMAAAVARNGGDCDMAVTARASEGYAVQALGQPRGQSVEGTVPAGGEWTVTVYRQPGTPAGTGTLLFTAQDQPDVSVDLLSVEIPPVAPPKEPYVVAIDFGTSKSAVVLFDQHRRGAEPQPVMWDSPALGKTPWVPSVVAFTGNTPVRFGWEVAQLGDSADIVRQLKMRLQESDPRVRAAIVFFLRKLFNQTASSFGRGCLQEGRIVLTLPVLDNGPEYQRQRDATLECVLEAGRAYNIRGEQVEFYAEPECAAVDFYHFLLRGNGGSQGAEMRPGDWLCVLDMGGGTTDVTFAQLGQDGGGALSFDTMQSIGFPHCAGDRIDREFLRWCLERLLRSGRVRGIPNDPRPPAGLSAADLADAPEVLLEGESRPVGRDESIDAMRQLKERMYASSPPVNEPWDTFTRHENHVTLSPEQLGKDVLVALADRMFRDGFSGSDATFYPPVRTKFDDLGLVPPDIRFLCLTGGTSCIPDFERCLRQALLLGESSQTVITPHPRLNVVRGAARRPSLRLHGRLPWEVEIICDCERGMLPAGSVSGGVTSFRRFFAPGEQADVEVRVLMPGAPTRTLFRYTAKNQDPSIEGVHLQAQLEYAGSDGLWLRLVWLTEGEAEELRRTLVQRVPCN